MTKLPAKPTLKTKLQRELAPLLIPIIAEAVHNALVDAGMLNNCLDCVHFNEATEGCAKAGGRRPPAETIVFGCELFTDGDPITPVEKPKAPAHAPPPAVEHKPPASEKKPFLDYMDDDIPF